MLSTSIVIPTKNSITTIDKCLSSLMPYSRQGYINEIIIVDSHSSDGTLDVVKGYPVKLIFEEIKGSIGMAYDTGWGNTQGERIILLDSDVYLENGFFPKLFEFFSDDKIGWVSCQPKAVVSNKLTKAQAEDWIRGTPMLTTSSRSTRERMSTAS